MAFKKFPFSQFWNADLHITYQHAHHINTTNHLIFYSLQLVAAQCYTSSSHSQKPTGKTSIQIRKTCQHPLKIPLETHIVHTSHGLLTNLQPAPLQSRSGIVRNPTLYDSHHSSLQPQAPQSSTSHFFLTRHTWSSHLHLTTRIGAGITIQIRCRPGALDFLKSTTRLSFTAVARSMSHSMLLPNYNRPSRRKMMLN